MQTTSLSSKPGRIAALFLACAISGFAQVPGDNFTNAVLLTGDAGTITTSNVGATSEPGEPIHAETVTGHSIWFYWTAATTGAVAWDTAGSSFDTVLAVYTGNILTSLSVVATNNDVTASNTTSRLVFRAVAETTYYILVDGASATTGTFNLSWSRGGPANDDFVNAQPLLTDSGQITGSTYVATREPGEPLQFNDNPGGHSVWYSWTAGLDEYLTVDTFGSSFDTLLALYTGTNITALTKIVSNDDFYEFTTNKASKVQTSVSAGTTYYIAIDGFNGASGNFILNWNATIKLNIAPTNTSELVLSWSAASQGFVLESSLLTSNTNTWASVTNQPVVMGDVNTVTVQRQTNAVFFRLRKSGS